MKLIIFLLLFIFSFTSHQVSLKSSKENEQDQDDDQELLKYYQDQLKKGVIYNETDGFDNERFIQFNPNMLKPKSKSKGSNGGVDIEYHHTDPPHFYKIPIQAELGFLTAQVIMGGKSAKKALKRLNAIANHVNMQKYMKAFLPIALACKVLLIKESEKWENRELCQSLFVRVTDIPVTTQYADTKSSEDYGKETSIVMPRPSRLYRPDREVAKLRAGSDLKYILDDKPLEY